MLRSLNPTGLANSRLAQEARIDLDDQSFVKSLAVFPGATETTRQALTETIIPPVSPSQDETWLDGTLWEDGTGWTNEES